METLDWVGSIRFRVFGGSGRLRDSRIRGFGGFRVEDSIGFIIKLWAS